MFSYGIIVIGYKNIGGILRLFNALNDADYGQDEVTLIVGIDYSEESAVRELAETFEWRYGKKIIKCQSQHLGLRRHILVCGSYIDEYNLDSVAVFEDDVMPSQDFYQYMKAATEKYYYESNVAGISLYLHQKNLNAAQKFQAIMDGQDAFFLQYPQSWGQVWFKEQWKEFYAWYKKNEMWVEDNLKSAEELPQNLMTWGDESWLKYHIKYCVINNKYFVYPYVPHATCFHEKGVHTRESSNELQVAIPMHGRMPYHFPDWNEEAVCYDVFFENRNLYSYVGISKDDLLVDLYGMHTFTRKRYLLTCRELPYTCIRSWGNKLIPHDMNIVYDIQGNNIHLYDLGTNIENIISIPVYTMKNRADENCMLLDRLLVCSENGINLAQKLLLQNIKSIAIYGCGIVGRHLKKALTDKEVNIRCFIDQYLLKDEIDGVQVIKLDQTLPKVDAIIITPTYDYEKIMDTLSKMYSGRLMSVLDLIT